jgi:hypothetical protein
MRRIILLVALAFMISGGAVYVAAQSGTEGQTDEVEVGADAGGCATPSATPDAEEITELLATAVASPEVTESLATAVASPDASPVIIDPCATPEMGTPAS